MARLLRIAPELPVADMAGSLQYYSHQLGFEVKMEMADASYAIVERDGVALHLFTRTASSRSPGSVHIFADGLDELLAEMQSRGARITQVIVRQPWGNRDFRTEDETGNTIIFTEPLAE